VNGYDVVIIGSGPGGYVAAIRAGQLGFRAAVVEKDELGGVCLNRGCIPTKSIIACTELYGEIQRASDFGIAVSEAKLDLAAIVDRKDQIVKKLSDGVGFLLKKHKVDVVRGVGWLPAPDRVEITEGPAKGTMMEACNVIIATGSRPATIPSVDMDGKRILNSTEILDLREIPKALLIVGAGYIGMEFACIFNALGTQVTVVELLPQILPNTDADISNALHKISEKRGVVFHTNSKVKGIEASEKGVTARVAGEEGSTEIKADYALISTGRRCNSADLGLETYAVKMDGEAIQVDDRMRTSLRGVYAIGDVTGKIQLAHVASAQGIVAVEDIGGYPSRMSYRAVPSCIFTHPEVAGVGLTEAEARDQVEDVSIGRFPYSSSGKAMGARHTDGFVKVIADSETNEVLGVHVLGHNASEVIAEATVAVQMEATVEDLVRVIHTHPTLHEAVKEAAEDVLGLSVHKG